MKRVEVNFCPLNSRTQKIHRTQGAQKTSINDEEGTSNITSQRALDEGFAIE